MSPQIDFRTAYYLLSKGVDPNSVQLFLSTGNPAHIIDDIENIKTNLSIKEDKYTRQVKEQLANQTMSSIFIDKINEVADDDFLDLETKIDRIFDATKYFFETIKNEDIRGTLYLTNGILNDKKIEPDPSIRFQNFMNTPDCTVKALKEKELKLSGQSYVSYVMREMTALSGEFWNELHAKSISRDVSYSPKSMITAPIMAPPQLESKLGINHAVGAIQLLWDNPGMFNEWDLEMITKVGDVITHAIRTDYLIKDSGYVINLPKDENKLKSVAQYLRDTLDSTGFYFLNFVRMKQNFDQSANKEDIIGNFGNLTTAIAALTKSNDADAILGEYGLRLTRNTHRINDVKIADAGFELDKERFTRKEFDYIELEKWSESLKKSQKHSDRLKIISQLKEAKLEERMLDYMKNEPLRLEIGSSNYLSLLEQLYTPLLVSDWKKDGKINGSFAKYFADLLSEENSQYLDVMQKRIEVDAKNKVFSLSLSNVPGMFIKVFDFSKNPESKEKEFQAETKLRNYYIRLGQIKADCFRTFDFGPVKVAALLLYDGSDMYEKMIKSTDEAQMYPELDFIPKEVMQKAIKTTAKTIAYGAVSLADEEPSSGNRMAGLLNSIENMFNEYTPSLVGRFSDIKSKLGGELMRFGDVIDSMPKGFYKDSIQRNLWIGSENNVEPIDFGSIRKCPYVFELSNLLILDRFFNDEEKNEFREDFFKELNTNISEYNKLAEKRENGLKGFIVEELRKNISVRSEIENETELLVEYVQNLNEHEEEKVFASIDNYIISNEGFKGNPRIDIAKQLVNEIKDYISCFEKKEQVEYKEGDLELANVYRAAMYSKQHAKWLVEKGISSHNLSNLLHLTKVMAESIDSYAKMNRSDDKTAELAKDFKEVNSLVSEFRDMAQNVGK
ncbi:MAG: hypothetical protein Q8O89_05595 [Nanoarchaeota archaeon]|nr:hypothetical protein [Nanoarchaeota archaeon]